MTGGNVETGAGGGLVPSLAIEGMEKIQPLKRGAEAVTYGSPGRIRTYNPPVNSRMLCR